MAGFAGVAMEKNLDDWISQAERSKHLQEDELRTLCKYVKEILSEESNMRRVDSPVTVCGDIHRQFHGLTKLFNRDGQVPCTNYIFMGDFVDRGYNSLEIFTTLLLLKARYPAQMTLLRGSHESRPNSQVQSFYEECQRKYGSVNAWRCCMDVFDYLTLSALIDGRVLCMHGGLSPDLRMLDQVRPSEKQCEVPHAGPSRGLMWSDMEEIKTCESSPRESRWLFGARATSEFNNIKGLELVCRVHQLVQGGHKYMFKGKKGLLMFWSSPSSSHPCGDMGSSKSFKAHKNLASQLPDLKEPFTLPNSPKSPISSSPTKSIKQEVTEEPTPSQPETSSPEVPMCPSSPDTLKCKEGVPSVVTSKRPRPSFSAVRARKRNKIEWEEKLCGSICGECPGNNLVTALVNIGRVRGNVVQYRCGEGGNPAEARRGPKKRSFALHLHERRPVSEERESSEEASQMRAETEEKSGKRRRKDAVAMDRHPRQASGRPPSSVEAEHVGRDWSERDCSPTCQSPENSVTDDGEDVTGPRAPEAEECHAQPSRCTFFNEMSRMHSNGRSWSNDEHRTYLNDIEEKFVDRLYRQEYCAFDVCGQSPSTSQTDPLDGLYDYSYQPPAIMDCQPLYPPFISQAYAPLVDEPNDSGECSGPMVLQENDAPHFVGGESRMAQMEVVVKEECDMDRENSMPAGVAPAFGTHVWAAFPYPSAPLAYDHHQRKPWQVLAPTFVPAMKWGSLHAQENVGPSARLRDVRGQERMAREGSVGVMCQADPAVDRHLESAMRGQLRFYPDYYVPQILQPAGQQAKRDIMDGWIFHKNEKLKMELMEEEQRLEMQFQMQERNMQLEEEVDSPLNPDFPSCNGKVSCGEGS